MAWICSGVKDATSAAKAGGTLGGVEDEAEMGRVGAGGCEAGGRETLGKFKRGLFMPKVDNAGGWAGGG